MTALLLCLAFACVGYLLARHRRLIAWWAGVALLRYAHRQPYPRSRR